LKSGTRLAGNLWNKTSNHEPTPLADNNLASTYEHIPVLLDEVISAIQPRPSGTYIDCTLGLGGHARAILEHSAPDGQLLGLDVDPQALRLATEGLAGFGRRATIVKANFAEVQNIAEAIGFLSVDGVLFDLGLSSMQLEAASRGFSFQNDAPLDMRMDPNLLVTAEDLVNGLAAEELANILYNYGEERRSRALSRAIVAAREQRPIRTTGQLSEVIHRVIHRGASRIDPSTRTFQALRIAVNGELEVLPKALPQAVSLLKPGGRLAIISFHSLEDRIVKRFIAAEVRGCVCPPSAPACVCGQQPRLQSLTRKPIVASQEERVRNPRSRSAKLRVAEKLTPTDKGVHYD
jgi:16S rRNA (cytosine1402-N4)-methyltransferase